MTMKQVCDEKFIPTILYQLAVTQDKLTPADVSGHSASLSDSDNEVDDLR